jgi:CubicO group peptidase (beta-lactamase class C family)
MKAISSLMLIVAALFIAPSGFAQSRQLQKTDSVLNLVRKYVRTNDADSIYNLTAPVYQKTISAGTFRNIQFQYLFPLGEIKSDSLISFINNKTASYKLQFKNAAILFILGLDRNGKIDEFALRGYKKDPGDKLYRVATSNPMLSATDKKVDSLARLYIQKANTAGLSIGLLRNGKISTYNYGETLMDDNKLPTANTIYEIASITKTFTATLLAYYANEGKLHLYDRVIKFLPDSVAANPELKDITLLNLTNHTSGLARLPGNMETQKDYDPLNPYKNYNKSLLFAYLKTCKLHSKPGENYEYSNLAASLLGIILEKVSGKSFEQMVAEIICTPLGMQSTSQHLSSINAPRMATGYNEDGKQTPAWDHDAMAAGGSLRSTVNDLLLYAKANMAKGTSPLSKAMQLTHQLTFNGDTKVGMGWHITNINGINYFYHNGGTFGSSSFLAYHTEKNIAVVILSNAEASTDNLGRALINLLASN